ncbi:tRNA lysidine(34) synthetase TilS [Lunatibacter salilacus]|uniref:tRNA lysidine(34) synthetase TilS n=1 Tax=Lunatibacter salilacus TaxID=2483804 RepID=UPI00131C3AB8|nr:tRNA lysidine(34) synthetase TilS [Lunatibacter salilacus]
MLDRFKTHIHSSGLLHKGKHYLLAISGGIDSVALAYLLSLAGFTFSMVHCNFQLRGAESEEDEQFIRNLGANLVIDVKTKRFDTLPYKKNFGVSTQMAARELRYAWFEELVRTGQGDAVLVAHHAGDQVETVLLNLLRGTGIEGVYGMAEHREGIIRPLLPFNREDITAFMGAEGLAWREDSSNEKSEYKRNVLRNEVLPLLKDTFGDVNQQLANSFGRIKDTGQAFFYFFESWKAAQVKVANPYEYLAFASLEGIPGKSSILFYWLREYGFNFAQVREIVQAMDAGATGKIFEGTGFMLNIDREHLILGPNRKTFEGLRVEAHDVELTLEADSYDILILGEGQALDKDPKNAMLDRDLLTFPLQIRNWEEGDKFKPLGMRHFKKISDFLIDLRIPYIQKQHIKVLCSGEDIVWLIGFRIDDRYKISSFTRQVMYIKQK